MSLELPYKERRALKSDSEFGTHSDEISRQLRDLSLNNRDLYARHTGGETKSFESRELYARSPEVRAERDLRNKETFADPRRLYSRDVRGNASEFDESRELMEEDVRASYKGPTRQLRNRAAGGDATRVAVPASERCLHQDEANRLLRVLEEKGGGFHNNIVYHPNGERALRVLRDDGGTLAMLSEKHVDRMLQDAIHGCSPTDTARQCRNCSTKYKA